MCQGFVLEMGFPLLFWHSPPEIQILLFAKLSMATFKSPQSIRIIRPQNINFQWHVFYRSFLGILPGLVWLGAQLGTHRLSRHDMDGQHSNAEDTTVHLALTSLLFSCLLFSASWLKCRPRLWLRNRWRPAISGFICKMRALLNSLVKYFEVLW